MTTPDDARIVSEAGADWVGINFHPASKRFVEPGRAAGIVAALRGPAEAVGLFVDRRPAEMVETADRAGLRIIQLHGVEPPETVADLRRDGYRVVRAFRLADREAIDRMESWLLHAETVGGVPEAVLIDAFVADQAGGTGHTIAAEVIDLLIDRLHASPFLSLGRRPERPGESAPNLILAGGLTPENVAAMARRVHPWMVDVASGVESRPGSKDPEKVAAFIQAARSVDS